ncbi:MULTISPECIES: universal stress protein [Nocardia]|uniref:universal stress protein n=1 Tax=Nocardia TaxID=1817 RepID=UPI0007E9F579|nr:MULTISPECIES: universal stress protein [Nocardia]MBF6277232.1 universal stress protein [Nocardia nova]OBB50477.1 hypothetical protein A5748_17825 [Nocardia sp. 852002-51244_SCH5132740]OBF65410.1 hypothetical protein A9X06_07755 [Mycobacterium sp. 852002-51759_SCH5129042]
MRTIVVGVDGSQASTAALRWAVNEARSHDAKVRVVTAWSLPYHQGEIGHLAGETMHELLVRDAERSLAAAVRAAEVDGDTVAIEQVVIRSEPARALLDAAADADLLVVGSRGRGGFSGLLLGSVSQKCAQHAPCPVVIVQPPEGDSPPTSRRR